MSVNIISACYGCILCCISSRLMKPLELSLTHNQTRLPTEMLKLIDCLSVCVCVCMCVGLCVCMCVCVCANMAEAPEAELTFLISLSLSSCFHSKLYTYLVNLSGSGSFYFCLSRTIFLNFQTLTLDYAGFLPFIGEK